MENRDNSSVLRSKAIVYGEIANMLSSAKNYEDFRDTLEVSIIKNDRNRGIFQIFIESNAPAMFEKRRKEAVGSFIEDVVMASVLENSDNVDAKLIFGIKKEAADIAKAWGKNPFIFEDCAAAKPEQIATYVDLIDKKLDLDSIEYPHLVVGYKKFLQNQRHDSYTAGETDILDSKMFVGRTGEKLNTPNWDMTNYKEAFEEYSQTFGE